MIAFTYQIRHRQRTFILLSMAVEKFLTRNWFCLLLNRLFFGQFPAKSTQLELPVFEVFLEFWLEFFSRFCLSFEFFHEFFGIFKKVQIFSNF